LRLNQVVTVNGSWHRCSVHTSRHKLQQSHLRNNDVSHIQDGKHKMCDSLTSRGAGETRTS
jgi:hypothetical protein